MEAQLLEAIEAIRPALQSDGGDVRVVKLDEENGVVDIELMGACGGCPMSTMTLKAGIERSLRDREEAITEVRAKGIEFDVGGEAFYLRLLIPLVRRSDRDALLGAARAGHRSAVARPTALPGR